MVARKLILESHIGDVTVITVKYPSYYETEVLGGELDGWLVTAKTPEQGKTNHSGVERLIRQTNRPGYVSDGFSNPKGELVATNY